MRGRKRKTPALRLMHGNDLPGTSSSAPVPSGKVPKPFPWMSKAAKAEWKRIAPEMYRRGLLINLDRSALAAYCEAFSTYIEAKHVVEAEGATYKAGDLVKKHPSAGIMGQAARDMAMWSRELGLIPTSRQRLGADVDPADVDPLQEFLNPNAEEA